MGAGQSQADQGDYENKLFTKLGAIKQNKAIMPLAAAVMLYQIKDLKPDQVDLSRADEAQRNEFAKMSYEENSSEWFYDGDCNNVNILLDQVSTMVDELDCNKWLVLYAFIRNGFNVDETKRYCLDNKVDKRTPVYNIPRNNDSEGWRVMYEKTLELGDVVPYVPPVGYKIKHLQMNMEQQLMQQMMSYGRGHNHDHNDHDHDHYDDQDQDQEETVQDTRP